MLITLINLTSYATTNDISWKHPKQTQMILSTEKMIYYCISKIYTYDVLKNFCVFKGTIFMMPLGC